MPERIRKLAIVGPGRSGKGEVCTYLSRAYGFRYTFGTSWVISRHIALEDGCVAEEAHARRHAERDRWRRVGDNLRSSDPAALARACLADCDLVEGVRSRVEIDAVIAERLVDLVIWVQREVPDDPTLEYGPDVADVVILNDGDLLALWRRLDRLMAAMGVAKT